MVPAYMIPKSILILSMYFRYIYIFFLTTISCIYVCTGSCLPTLRHLLTIPRPSSHTRYWRVDQEYVFEVHNQVLFPHQKAPIYMCKCKENGGRGRYSCLNTGTLSFFTVIQLPPQITRERSCTLFSECWPPLGVGGVLLADFHSYVGNLKSLWGSEGSLYHSLSSTNRKMLSFQGHVWGDCGWVSEKHSQGRDLNNAWFLTFPCVGHGWHKSNPLMGGQAKPEHMCWN